MNRIEINYTFWSHAIIYVIPILGLFGYLTFAPAVYFRWAVVGTFVLAIAFGLFLAFRRWTAPKPLILINDDGITDNRCCAGVVSWADIQNAKLTNHSKAWIALKLKDPELYADRKAATRLTGRIERAMLTGDLTILLSGTDCDPEQVFVAIQKRLAQNE